MSFLLFQKVCILCFPVMSFFSLCRNRACKIRRFSKYIYGKRQNHRKIKSSETAEETNFLCFLCCFNFMSYYPFCMLLYNSSNHLYKQVYILLPSSHPVNWDIKTYKLIFYINMREPLYAGTPACPFLIIFNDNDVLYWKQNVFSILLKFFNLNFSLLLPFHQTVSIFHTLISHLLIT